MVRPRSSFFVRLRRGVCVAGALALLSASVHAQVADASLEMLYVLAEHGARLAPHG
ncbi:hypothetical protein H3V53_20275 [Paraburkholderia bengalensis]|uniref:Uncharacterized protein n=1 Tax=Paraburkholderia bengalensis TaxID=2747562 RepID=A0ABU8IVH9_9BURK